jgi:hypothetical protein
MNADGTRRSVLFTDPERNALAPTLSPQGDRIAFGLGGFFQGINGPAKADIAVMSTDGTVCRFSPMARATTAFRAGHPMDGDSFIVQRATTRTACYLSTSKHVS